MPFHWIGSSMQTCLVKRTYIGIVFTQYKGRTYGHCTGSSMGGEGHMVITLGPVWGDIWSLHWVQYGGTYGHYTWSSMGGDMWSLYWVQYMWERICLLIVLVPACKSSWLKGHIYALCSYSMGEDIWSLHWVQYTWHGEERKL